MRHSSSRSATCSLNPSSFSGDLLGERDLLLDLGCARPLFLLLDLLRLPDLFLLLVDLFLLLDRLGLIDLLCEAFWLFDRLFDFGNDFDFDFVTDLFLSTDVDCRLRFTESSFFSLETLLLLEGVITVVSSEVLPVSRH